MNLRRSRTLGRWLLVTVMLLTSWSVHAGLEEGLTAYRNKNYQGALNEMLPLAKSGNARAQNVMGLLYQGGHGVPQDHAESLRWLLLSAEQNEPTAFNNLGLVYSKGLGVKQDHVEAVKWYTRAADAGSELGTYNLAYKYEKGEGIRKNYVEALRLYQMGAQRGHAPAEVAVGRFYEEGMGGASFDAPAAALWYRKAVVKDHPDAYRRLGLLHEKGLGVEKNTLEARRLYGMALEKGINIAKRDLARLDHRALIEQPKHLQSLPPEKLAALYFDAFRLQDWGGLALFFAEQDVRAFAGLIVDIMEMEARANSALVRGATFRRNVTTDELRAMPPRHLIGLFMENFLGPVYASASLNRARVLGLVKENDGLVHILARLYITSGNLATEELETISFTLEQVGWGMKLQDKMIRELRNMLATAN